MPGPPPARPEERRCRNATIPMIQVPAGGHQGPAPGVALARSEPR